MLGIEHVDSFPWMHGPVRRLPQVGTGRVLLHLGKIGRAHRSERGRHAATRHLGAPPVDLQLLEAVLVDHHAQRAVAELGVDVVLPQRRRLQDVAVGVDGPVDCDLMRLVDRLPGGDGDSHGCTMSRLRATECPRRSGDQRPG